MQFYLISLYTIHIRIFMQLPKILLSLCLIITLSGFPQHGRLLLVGGGPEKNGVSSWSTPAYRWAGEGKRVAIIGTSTGSLAPYFTQQCGAAFAREFAIATRDSANSQFLYDTLLTYQVIFFRGGDQYEYYNLYRNTKLQDAVDVLYHSGGTICGTSAGMHILSSVVFTAKNGTVYPYESIENPNNIYVTLANDFLNFVPGYIFDTHVAERARFARTIGFLANYKMNNDEDITGLGMDDMTCMTVDTNGLGTVYGTGCANIYKSGSSYSLNGTKLLADKVDVVQLLQGCTYNFNTHEVTLTPLNHQLNTGLQEETGNYTVLASGGNKLNDNQTLLNEFVTRTGQVTDSVLILTGDEMLANPFKDKLIQLGSPGVDVILVNSEAGSNTDFQVKIHAAKKILFIANLSSTFIPFLDSENGKLLFQKLHSNGMISGFVGDDARFACKTVVDNYYEMYASWYGEMIFNRGLSLLRNTVIMPNTYFDSDMYENSATAVPYAMALDTLKYGIWLTNHNCMKFSPVDGNTTLKGYGDAPVMVVRNAGLLAGFSTQTGTGSTSTKPRMVAGFERLELSMIDYTTPYVMGTVNTSGISSYTEMCKVEISPNPAADFILLTLSSGSSDWEIMDFTGKKLLRGISEKTSSSINISNLQPGLYIVKTISGKSNQPSLTKFIKQ